MRRLIALLLALLLPLTALAEEVYIEEEILLDEVAGETAEPAETEAPVEEPEEKPEAATADTGIPELVTTEDGSFPELNSEGFLDAGEFVYENPEDGVWRYVSNTLKVEILRCSQTSPRKLIWYEAEVWTRGDEYFHLLAWNDKKRMTDMKYPHEIARKHATVLALSTDFAQLRYQQKARMGIIVREGEIYSNRTKTTGKFPPLDVLAIYPDGNMEVYGSSEHTAQEYLDMGVSSTMAFGPYLIRDGVPNEKGMKEYGTSKAPRVAVGMVEPGHYYCMMLEGRHKDSVGGPVRFLGEKLYERGCTVGMNLDGGATACIVFMGTQICRAGNENATAKTKARRTSEILGIGTSYLVPSN